MCERERAREGGKGEEGRERGEGGGRGRGRGRGRAKERGKEGIRIELCVFGIFTLKLLDTLFWLIAHTTANTQHNTPHGRWCV